MASGSYFTPENLGQVFPPLEAAPKRPVADISTLFQPPRDVSYEGLGGYFGQVSEDRLAGMFEKTRTPLERFNQLMEEQALVLQENSYFADSYSRELLKMVDAADKGQDIRSPAAVLAGTTAGYSAMVAAGNYAAGAGESQAQRLERVMKDMKDEQARTTRAVEEMTRAMREQKAPNVLQLPGA
jgi:hypothetical protein